MIRSISKGIAGLCAGLAAALALTCVPALAQPADSIIHDIRFEEIMEPVSLAESGDTLYRTRMGEGVPLKVRFFNAGIRTYDGVTFTTAVRNDAGVVISSAYSIIRGTWPPGTSRTLEREIALFYGGEYSVEVCADLAGDDVPWNDCSPRRKFRWFTRPYEIQAASPDTADVLPLPGKTYMAGENISPRAVYRNVGEEEKFLTPSIARMIIRGPSGTVVYHDSASIDRIDTVGRMKLVNFPSRLVLSDGPGIYEATASAYQRHDPLKTDDTARWNFRVAPVAGVGNAEGSGIASAAVLAAHPNPAHERIQVAYRVPVGMGGRLRIHGADGRETAVAPGEMLSGEGTISIPSTSLPSGLYTVVMEFADGSSRSTQVLVRH